MGAHSITSQTLAMLREIEFPTGSLGKITSGCSGIGIAGECLTSSRRRDAELIHTKLADQSTSTALPGRSNELLKDFVVGQEKATIEMSNGHTGCCEPTSWW
ncbi:hypothetical protein PGT21_006215 [Puccinia graminis f. sp. tritici]|uniref:Uncharacterized protein n=1 Tax=Puccinia graminis f. sp. tritici TaxID=56615 RepID=A0A5B0NWU8_PUCGR|nr:hypothetical protein PGT21_006215 [Puccinia graminis f. sp. tritici]KAA1093635.1 hypothetical protein PGTUg99_012239 [Puccinia graminis f. sp. tritici]